MCPAALRALRLRTQAHDWVSRPLEEHRARYRPVRESLDLLGEDCPSALEAQQPELEVHLHQEDLAFHQEGFPEEHHHQDLEDVGDQVCFRQLEGRLQDLEDPHQVLVVLLLVGLLPVSNLLRAFREARLGREEAFHHRDLGEGKLWRMFITWAVLRRTRERWLGIQNRCMMDGGTKPQNIQRSRTWSQANRYSKSGTPEHPAR